LHSRCHPIKCHRYISHDALASAAILFYKKRCSTLGVSGFAPHATHEEGDPIMSESGLKQARELEGKE
jgi:hypothetical protein